VGGTLGLLREGAVDQRRHLLVADAPRRAGAGLVEQPVRALAREALAPLADRVLGDAEFIRDRRVAQALGGPQHDARPQRERLGGLTAPSPALEFGALRLAQLQRRRCSVGHPRLHICPTILS
jgi:hypothetical protein